MHLEKGKDRASPRGAPTLSAFGLAMFIAGAALAKTVPFAGGQFSTDGQAVPGRGGDFARNVSIRSLQLGDRTLRFEDGKLRAPIQVRVASGETASPLTEAGMIALTPDLPEVAGMTALDAFSGADLGRMVQTDALKPTCVQVFLAMQERDDDAFADDRWPELVLLGAADGAGVRVTPILDGTPDVPATLVFGTPHEVPAAAFAKGLMPLRIDYTGRKAPQAMAAVGLDLSGDLGIAPGQSVVGYQIEVPAGASMPIKVIAAGQVEFGAYANFADTGSEIGRLALGQMALGNPSLNAAEDSMTSIVGPVFLGSGTSATTDGAADVAGMNQPAGPSFSPGGLEGFQDSGSTPFNTPPVFPTPIPAPGVAALLGAAVSVMLNPRRRG